MTTNTYLIHFTIDQLHVFNHPESSVVTLYTDQFFCECIKKKVGLLDMFEKILVGGYGLFVIFFLAEFNMIADDEKQADTKNNGKDTEKSQNEFKVKTPGFNITATVWHYNKRK